MHQRTCGGKSTQGNVEACLDVACIDLLEATLHDKHKLALLSVVFTCKVTLLPVHFNTTTLQGRRQANCERMTERVEQRWGERERERDLADG